MDEADAFDLATDIQERWQNAADDIPSRAAALFAELQAVSLVDARAALAAIGLAGDRDAAFVPTPGMILRKVAELAVAPLGWDEVRRQLVKRCDEVDALNRPNARFAWTCPYDLCDGDGLVVDEEARTAGDCRCRPEYIAARRAVGELDAMVRQWIDDRYVTWPEVRSVAEGDSTVEAQMRQKWEAYANRAIESRALVLLPNAAPSRRLAQAEAEDRRLVERQEHRSQLRGLSAGPGGATILDALDVRFEREHAR